MKQETVGARLRLARRRFGDRLTPPRDLEKKELGAMVGVTGQAVGQWEAGLREPDLDTIRRLAGALEVRAPWLAFGEGPMRDEDGGSGKGSAPRSPRAPAPFVDVPLDAFVPVPRPAKKKTRRRA